MDTWEKIDDRLKANKPLTDRMDATKDLLYMVDFSLTAFDGKTALENVINVTGNRGASYGLRVIENLASYKWQTVVEGEVTKREAHTIEGFLNANLDQTNIYLSENFDDVPDLYTFWAKHICNRGRIGTQWMSWVEKGEYKIHCVPLDMRWTPYVKGRWVAPIYFRKQAELEQELERYEKKGKEKGGGEYKKETFTGDKDREVRDYWDNELHELWVDKKLVFTEKNIYGKPPFVIVVSPSGFMFRDQGYIEHEGEDIYFLIRKLEKELNRSLSIEQSIGMDVLNPPYVQPRKVFDGKPADAVPRTGETASVREGEEFKLLPRGDLNRGSQVARADIIKMMDDGAPMQPRAYTQPPSAVEVATEVELLNQLYNSRVTALQMGLSQLYRLMIDMCILVGKGKLEIGGYGKQKQFSVVQLKDPKKYSISCQLMGKNTKLDIINESRALALWGRAPLKYILEDVLKVEDPDGWVRELELEEAKKADPAIALSEMGIRYAEEAEEMEDPLDKELKNFQSMLLIERAVSIIKARMQPAPLPLPQEATVPKVEQPKGSANALLALTGQAGKGVGQPKQPAGVI